MRTIVVAWMLALSGLVPCHAMAQAGGAILSGHVPPLPAAAQLDEARSKSATSAAQPLTLTVVLKRSDPDGYARFLAQLYDPRSPGFRSFLDPRMQAERFGPSAQDYAMVRDWFAAQGLTPAAQSPGRQTLTLKGRRDAVEAALGIAILDYGDGKRAFFANDAEPVLPPQIAARVQAVLGLSDLAQPRRGGVRIDIDLDAAATPEKRQAIIDALRALCKGLGGLGYGSDVTAAAEWNKGCDAFLPAASSNGSSGGASSGHRRAAASKSAAGKGGAGAWIDLDGAGQRIALLQFDTLVRSAAADHFALLGLPADTVDRLHEVHVNGGAAPGPDQAEVLLDVGFVMPLVPAADVVVYDAPFTGSGSFQALFSRMIDDGVDIISNSWSYCENQTTLVDVSSIDAILQTAAAAGIGVFNASGDSGSTCLNGSLDTVGVPSGSPHATAVGGSSSQPGAGQVHGIETWWNASAATPPGGQGGFGVSRFFARPAYQNGATAAPMRSVPDLVTNADPTYGIQICQAANGGCPAPYLYGGTSLAAPSMAAYAARMNQANGSNLGFLNPQIYPLAGGDAFHSAADLGSDFAHVGLGSPNVNRLFVRLGGAVLGAVDAQLSQMAMSVRIEDAETVFGPADGIPADGTTPLRVTVTVRDTNGNTLDGRSVALSANPGSEAVIAPASALSSLANGAVVFTVTDLSAETVTFSASVDGVPIDATVEADFVVPPATGASILASPTTVTADGSAQTVITVQLVDGIGRPTPGKLVTLSQGGGHAAIAGPTPSLTGSDGSITFTATNRVEEAIEFIATDVTDGDLRVPGSATVTFTNAPQPYCVPAPPTPAPGYTIAPFVTGMAVGPLFYGNINFGNCVGTNDPAFDPAGNVIVTNLRSGDVFRLPPEGGAATAPVSSLGPTIGRAAYGRDGRLYAPRAATTGNFTTGDIIEIDPQTGALLRVVVPNLTCPTPVAADPLSGDLFFGGLCFGGGADVPHIYRITDPGDVDPEVPTEAVLYATLPTTPTGQLAFAPDGTLYAVTGYITPGGGTVTRIAGTDQPQPPAQSTVPDVRSSYTLAMGAARPDGSALSLLAMMGDELVEAHIDDDPVTFTTLAERIGAGVIGPDGCMYSPHFDTIYRLAAEDGSCNFSASNPAPSLTLSPARQTVDPASGQARSFVATARNLDVPAGTPVFFQVTGANAQTRLERTDADGRATLTLTGVFAGRDTIVAVLYDEALRLNSNKATVTWSDGVHTSFLALSPPFGADPGVPVELAATLVDVSLEPTAPIVGANVHFDLAGATCDAISDASGSARCSVTVSTPGDYLLQTSFAGDAMHGASEASSRFLVVGEGIFSDGFEP